VRTGGQFEPLGKGVPLVVVAVKPLRVVHGVPPQ
jgi:hypothetical protein